MSDRLANGTPVRVDTFGAYGVVHAVPSGAWVVPAGLVHRVRLEDGSEWNVPRGYLTDLTGLPDHVTRTHFAPGAGRA